MDMLKNFRTKKFLEISLITTVIGLTLILLNFIFFVEIPQIFAVLNMVAAVILLGIPLLYRYIEYSRLKKIEAMFPTFLTDVTENINTGMTLPQAMRTIANNDYGVLTPYVKEMSAKIGWGIPFEKVLTNFSTKIGSDVLQRTTKTILEAHKSGGTMNTVLSAVADSLQQLERIKKERSSSIYAQMINGYLIYIVFLGVMIGLSTFLIPAFQWEETGDMANLQDDFIEMFRYLIIIQGFFAGLSVGKMAEGTLLAGIKHSLVLSVFGYSLFLIFV